MTQHQPRLRPSRSHALDIQCGTGDLGFYSKGFHSTDEFTRALRDEWDRWIPPQSVERQWWRCVPNPDQDEGGSLFYPAKPHSPGAFPVTFTYHTRPRCSFCPACRDAHKRRSAEAWKVRNRKMMIGLWRRAKAGELIRLDLQERGGHIEYVHFPYRDLDEQRRRQAA